MALDRNTILKMIAAREADIRAYGVRRLALFGSAARDEITEKSDLDFIVEFDRKSFDAYMDLKALLEDLFGTSVDLVIVDAIKPRLRDRILEEAVDVPGL